MEPHLTQHELWPCDPIITFKSQFKVCHFQICYIAAESKSDNYKPISVPKTAYGTLVSPNLKCNFLTQLSPSNVDLKSAIYSTTL